MADSFSMTSRRPKKQMNVSEICSKRRSQTCFD